MKTVFVLKLVGYKYSEYEGNTSSKPKYCKLRLEIGNINNDPAPLKPLQTNLLKTIKCFEVFTNDFRFVLLCIYNVYTFVLSKDKKQRRTNNFLTFFCLSFSFSRRILCVFIHRHVFFFTFWLVVPLVLSSILFFLLIFVPNVNCFLLSRFFSLQTMKHSY